MTNLNKETLKNLTLLSRIECSEEEQEALVNDLGKILRYVEQLQEVNTENVPPCNHVLAGMVNVMRDDICGNTLSRETFLANSPSHTGGMIRVPPVIKKQQS